LESAAAGSRAPGAGRRAASHGSSSAAAIGADEVALGAAKLAQPVQGLLVPAYRHARSWTIASVITRRVGTVGAVS
jgi:hypothetical protein